MKNTVNFTAPVGDSNKIDNVELIPVGMQLCTLYSMVDVGTQTTNFGLKRQVKLAFEFPQVMRVFYEGNDPQPAAVFETETLSMNEKANLRKKFVQPMINKKLSDEEAGNFDIASLLGRHFVATISHSPDGKWANIQSISPLDEKNCLMFGLQSPQVPIINDLQFYHLSQGFDCPEFGQLPKKLRENLMTSVEGEKHRASGGTFAEYKKPDANGGGTAPAGPNAPSQGNSSGLEMIATDASYEAYINAGWTDQQLIDHGKAKKKEPVAPPTTAAAPPVSAPPATPPVSTPPSQPKKKVLVFKDPSHPPLAEWIKTGWTEEQVIAEGYASYQEVDADSPHDDNGVPF